MNMLTTLRRQMEVIRNPCLAENLGGLHLHYVGIGHRSLSFTGWWKSFLDFYVINWWDGPGSLPMRVQGKAVLRPMRSAMLQKPRVLFEEFFERPFEGQCFFVLFKGGGRHAALDALIRRPGYCLFDDEDRRVPELIQKISFVASPDAGQRWLAKAAFLELLAQLHQSLCADEPGKRRIVPLVSNQLHSETGFRQDVFHRLRENPAITLGGLAKLLGISRSSLSHRFVREMGEPFAHLKNRLRMESAHELLANSSMQVKEIAFASGFEDAAYFSRIFQKTTGISPRQYREMIHQESARS
ncbi:MAG: AraC family transcriptional regulator [Cupriavidus sp.]|nr:MAG: AraC family transcriptional regulator [Cupriavidus sp.]